MSVNVVDIASTPEPEAAEPEAAEPEAAEPEAAEPEAAEPEGAEDLEATLARLRAELDALRAERTTEDIMREYSLPEACATLLHGTRDKQVEQAKVLAELIKSAEPKPAPSVPVDPAAVSESADDAGETRLKQIQAFLGLD